MYFLVVLAIAGSPQGLTQTYKTLKECEAKKAEVAKMLTGDASITAYAVECIRATEPGKGA